jgi:hypothetical protein
MLVVPGRESAPVLELVEGTFDDVAVLVVLGVEADRPAAAGTADSVIVRFVPATQRFLVIRPSPLCDG